ncbi:MAG: hypothetical protein U1U88_001970 [Lawsonella clevelandensis]
MPAQLRSSPAVFTATWTDPKAATSRLLPTPSIHPALGRLHLDLDGNKFIDHMAAAYGPMIQGYADEEVNEAAFKACRNGDCVTLPGTLSIPPR